MPCGLTLFPTNRAACMMLAMALAGTILPAYTAAHGFELFVAQLEALLLGKRENFLGGLASKRLLLLLRCQIIEVHAGSFDRNCTTDHNTHFSHQGYKTLVGMPHSRQYSDAYESCGHVMVRLWQLANA